MPPAMNSASLHCRGKRSPAYRLHRDRSVPSAHPNAGCRRNPGRNDGLTWNGASFVCVDQIGDYSDSDPFSDVCPVCEEEYQKEASTRRPRTIEISLAEIPMKVSKPKTRKVRGHEDHPSAPQTSFAPRSGKALARPDSETLSNSSWDAMSSDCNLTDLSSEDWEDLESAYTHDTPDYESDQDFQVARNDSNSPNTTPPRRTYAQVLGGQQQEAQE